MDEKKKHELFAVGGLVAVGALALFFFRPPGSAQPQSKQQAKAAQQNHQGPTKVPNPANASIEAAVIAAKESLVEAYDESVLSEKGLEEQQNTTNNQTAAAKAVAFNTNATAFKTAGLQATEAETLQSAQLSAQQQEEQAALSAQQAEQPQWWQQLLQPIIGGLTGWATGGFSSIFSGLFGGSSAPTGGNTSGFPAPEPGSLW